MYYAFDSTKQKISASPKIVGFCPECQQKLIPKCGEINQPHWAHQSLNNCDYKPDSNWSLSWKSLFIIDWVEYRQDNRVADLKLPNNLIFEFQHSSISPEEIRDKQVFWSNVIWIFNQEKSAHNFYKVFSSTQESYLTTSLIDSYKSFDLLQGDVLGTGFILINY